MSAPAPAQCLYDAGVDGHPLFRSLNQRADVELLESVDGIAGAWPIDMAFGDLDGDGDLDGAFVSIGAGKYLTILLNRGDGVFDPPDVYFAGMEPHAVALGDVDADGDLDVSVANRTDGTVSVFLNDGRGALARPTTHAVGDAPTSVVAADLNADGLADLAVLNAQSDDVSILIATGAGAFAPEVRVDVGVVTPEWPGNPHPGPFMAAADLDADGDVDLVVPSATKLSILHNNGSGRVTLNESINLGVPDLVNDIAIADFNGDGLPDLAALLNDLAGYAPEAIVVVLRTRDGWGEPDAYDGGPLDYWHRSIDAGDIDNDGDVDIAAGMFAGIGAGTALFRNRGDGTFEHQTHPTLSSPWVVGLADLNGDGWLDLAHSNGLGFSKRGNVRIHLNDGHGNFVAPSTSPDSDDLDCRIQRTIASADLDLDGDLDVVGGAFSCGETTLVNVFENDGTGEFSVATEITLVPREDGARLQYVDIADLNADALPDIVAVDEGPFELEADHPGSIWILRNQGGLSFGPPTKLPFDTDVYRVTLSDLNGDGHIDMAAVTHPLTGEPGTPPRTVEIFLNDGAGTLAHWQSIVLEDDLTPSDGIQGRIASADLDADGDVDIVATVSSEDEDGRVLVLENDGAATFTIISDEPVGHQPTSILLHDLDGDDDTDMALILNQVSEATEIEPYLKILHNDGRATFTLVQEVLDPSILPKWNLHAADFNADGHPDLATDLIWGAVLVHLSNGDGTFAPGVSYDTGDVTTIALTVGDFDVDGRDDAVAGATIEDNVLILLRNESCPPCPADMNTDGTLDILDFITFQQLFLAADPAADCNDDGQLSNPADFICYQQRFQAGCK